MESGGIPDFCITASSSRQFIKDLQPQFGRLNNPDIAWWSDLQQPGEWLKIDLVRKMIVTKIATRGRPDYGSSWVTSYKISFSQDDRRQPSWISRPQMGSLQGARDGYGDEGIDSSVFYWSCSFLTDVKLMLFVYLSEG